VTVARAGGIRTVIVGASGRMGRQLLRVIKEFPALRLHGAVVAQGSGAVGQDAGTQAGAEETGILITDALAPLLEKADLVVDFSSPSATAATVAACVSIPTALLIGTTALSPGIQPVLDRAAESIALLVAANTSLGVNLLLALVRQAAHTLPASYDIEIVEAHHAAKRDAPSGTALSLGEAAAAGRGVMASQQAVYARHDADQPRQQGEIGFASIRGGDVVGEHEVWFLGPGERVLLKHSATDRSVFARGALVGGQWLAGQRAGRYTMPDAFNTNAQVNK
jgi:4-hydroxy-tetrahydrodipicolinate reductase